MLNLYDYLTPLDSKRIENYITEWGTEDGYVGNDTYLSYWKENNKKLFHLLGGNLIVKRPFSYEKPQFQLESEMHQVIRDSQKLFDTVYDLLQENKKQYDMTGELVSHIYDCFCNSVIISDKVRYAIKFKAGDKKGTLQIQSGMKPIRAMQKIIQYFGWNVTDLFEKFRIQHSMVLNEKIVKGDICISIHPLDFMTMSDNASDWSSCMSWMEQGCYHVGTVEMMNSNNVVCAYIESKTPFKFGRSNKPDHVGEEWTWNNKKWRQLFYVTKDIIVGGKSYPYANEDFTKEVIKILRELAQENLAWTYSFGPELYKDMIHIGSLYRMDRNKSWVHTGKTFKHNIIFDTKGMYNDMLNDQYREYWCIRNKVKKTKIISYSGKAPCACCMDPVIEETDDCSYYDDGAYNDRYDGVRHILCRSCIDNRYCNWCGNEDGYYKTYKLGENYYCSNCWDKYIRKCPDCGKAFQVFPEVKDNIVIRRNTNTIWLQDVRAGKMGMACACDDCKKKMIQNGVLEEIKIHADTSRQYCSWNKHATMFVTKEVYAEDSEFEKHYSYKNLAKISAEEYAD